MKYEDQIAAETAAGREGLRVWEETQQAMSNERRLEKAFEITETVRQIMRAGLRHQYPEKTEEEIHELYVNELLKVHGYTLEKVRRLRAEQIHL